LVEVESQGDIAPVPILAPARNLMLKGTVSRDFRPPVFTLFEVVRKFSCACGVNDTASIVHVVSLTLHALSMTPHAF
jgi:hypothetical protein